MKNIIKPVALLIATALFFGLGHQKLYAQISLPYYTGFNTASEQDDWTEYRLGELPLSIYQWGYSGGDPGLAHYYPVGSNTLTNNWMVSEEFDFSSGATIDSMRFNGSGFGMPFGIDTVALYLIQGHQHPDSASSQVLLKLFTDSSYDNYGGWQTYYSIVIPPTNGPAYLAFRYQTVINWLDVFIDDLYVSSENSGVFEKKDVKALNIYPNPVVDKIFIDNDKNLEKITLFNDHGQLVKTAFIEKNTIDVSSLSAGIYLIQVETTDGLFAQRFIKE